MKITPPTASDKVKEMMKGMKNNQAARTDILWSNISKYGGNEMKTNAGNREQRVRGRRKAIKMEETN